MAIALDRLEELQINLIRSHGAMDVVNGGRVRIDPALPPEQRFALAAASAAILLRTDLASSVEEEA